MALQFAQRHLSQRGASPPVTERPGLSQLKAFVKQRCQRPRSGAPSEVYPGTSHAAQGLLSLAENERWSFGRSSSLSQSHFISLTCPATLICAFAGAVVIAANQYLTNSLQRPQGREDRPTTCRPSSRKLTRKRSSEQFPRHPTRSKLSRLLGCTSRTRTATDGRIPASRALQCSQTTW